MLSVENMNEYKKKNADKINQVLLGIDLAREEEATLLWLCGLDHYTVDNMVSIMEKVKNRHEPIEPADKLYEALNTVREHCAKRGRACKGCLLNTDTVYGGCDFLDENPEDWDLGFLNQAIKKDPAAGTAKVSK